MALPRERHTTGGDKLQSASGAVRQQLTGGSTGNGDWRDWRRGTVRETIKPEGMLAEEEEEGAEVWAW